MAALLAADVEIVPKHRLDDVAVADFRAQNLAAVRGDRLVEAEVAHDRGDERVSIEPSGPEKIHRGDRHDLVAVHDLAVLVAKQRAVRVAVVGDAHMRTGFLHIAARHARDACCRSPR